MWFSNSNLNDIHSLVSNDMIDYNTLRFVSKNVW